MRNLILILIAFITSLNCTAQTPPCGLIYGTDSDREQIQLAMFSGTVLEVETAINQAKDTRKFSVGCPQEDYGPYTPSNITQPSLAEIEQVWNSIYVPGISAFEIDCPDIGRHRPALGLGAYYAKLGGYFEDNQSLINVANSLLSTQYTAENAATPLVAMAGIYAYLNPNSSTECNLTGVAGNSTSQFCEVAPELCPTYNGGLYEGKSFGVTDHTFINGELLGDIGGAGFDHGWAGVFILESALQQTDPELKEKYRESALLAGEWAIAQPLVTNHNYTSKLIWLLAQLYAWSGREDFKAALIDRLDRNLIPGVLMDNNRDGFVDGMSDQMRFTDLAQVAQVPGRNWDGHNALPWYHSMNSWAVLEAYVAFRDRGDDVLAAKYKPYVIAMIDNLAHEFVNIGTPPAGGPGSRDIPFSILSGIWKLAQYENEAHPLWEQAAWAIWNTGIFQSASERGVNIPLYLLIKNQVPFVPLHIRASPVTSLDDSRVFQGHIKIYPNPTDGIFQVNLGPISDHAIRLTLHDQSGRVVLESVSLRLTKDIDTSHLPGGVYMVKIESTKGFWVGRLIKK